MRTVVLLALAYGLAARLVEMLLSARNARRVLARGGRRVEPDGFAGLAAVHAAWFAGMAIEELARGPSWSRPLPIAAAWAVFALAELGRYACIATLGDRWNVRVLVEDGAPRVRRGIYRRLRHPNYLFAALGIAALPLALALPITALALTPLKLLAVARRLAIEERALAGAAGGGPAAEL